MPGEARALKDVRRFQSEAAYLREVPDPIGARLTIHVIVAGFLVLGLVAFFAEIDRVVESAFGKVATLQNPTVYQALDASIVKSLNVHEGERIAKGQLIATLDPTFARADARQLRQQAASLRATIARDNAELSGKPLEYPPASDPDEQHYNLLQMDLFRDRQAQYAAQLRSFDERVGGTQATLTKLGVDTSELERKSEIAHKLEAMRTVLLEKGAGSLVNQLQSQSDRLEAQRLAEYDRNSLVESEHQLSQTKADRESFVKSWAAALRLELVTSQNALDSALAQLEKAAFHQNLVEIRASEDALILTAPKISVGSVLKEGDVIYTAAPLDAPIEVDIRIRSRDIGFVRPGDAVTLKIDAFSSVEHGAAEGVVKAISEGAFFLDDETNQPTEPYYKARIEVREMKFVNVPKTFRLVPGMTLTADINVGKRSAAVYLLEGFVKTLQEAMREP